MQINFFKYQGTGNDFIIIDQRAEQFLTRNDVAKIQKLCDRRFGIGADGLMLLQNIEDFAFEMIYFNADGNESTMCGNGGRCIIAFAKYLDIFDKKCQFLAIDGAHDAAINDDGDFVELKMIDVKQVKKDNEAFVLNTGSPHYVTFVDDMSKVDVYNDGKAIRYNDTYKQDGINVNFLAEKNGNLEVTTYERGVEDETYSCGTGVTAAAIAYAHKHTKSGEFPIHTKGGNLMIRLESDGYIGYKNIWLCGPAVKVYEGTVNIQPI